VLDEAHLIKDSTTKAARAAYAIKADRRWCVTGTPIQNKLEDLFSLILFLNVQPCSSHKWWTQFIAKPVRIGDDRGFARLRIILSAVLLRRTKDQKVNDSPIVSLPPKYSKIRRDILSPEEEDFYQSLWNASVTQFNSFVKAGTVLQNYAHVLELLLRLRQACDHPYLALNKNKKIQEVSVVVQKYLENPEIGQLPQIQEAMSSWTTKECAVCHEEMEGPVVTACCHFFCTNCIKGQATCPICFQPLESTKIIPLPKKQNKENEHAREHCNSTKLNSILEELIETFAQDPSNKCIIFSQWTSMLDLVELTLKAANYKFVRLDGTMTHVQRTAAINAFNQDNSIKIFLISMKAGGLGLNLVSASHVMLLDPWWNPATEEQAIDRVHRLGQTKPVFVTRFIIQGSVEEKILELQDKKRNLIQGALSSSQKKENRLEELALLFAT